MYCDWLNFPVLVQPSMYCRLFFVVFFLLSSLLSTKWERDEGQLSCNRRFVASNRDCYQLPTARTRCLLRPRPWNSSFLFINTYFSAASRYSEGLWYWCTTYLTCYARVEPAKRERSLAVEQPSLRANAVWCTYNYGNTYLLVSKGCFDPRDARSPRTHLRRASLFVFLAQTAG